MASRNLIIYCDESTEKGRYYSNFYGGALVRAADRQSIENRLIAAKTRNNFFGEVKWTKITVSYKDKYIDFVKEFFDLIEDGSIKVRIMFTQNSNEVIGLEDEQIENKYFLLYYQFVKHAFGLMYCGEVGCDTRITLYLDEVPKNETKFNRFKSYVESVAAHPRLVEQRVSVPQSEIASVDSKHHVILQGLDIVLGAIQFRLNDRHREIPVGKRRRAKRTVAKEEVYNYINSRIRSLYPRFNIGVSTGVGDTISNRWLHPYRHWLFIPNQHRVRVGVGKARNKQAPPATNP